jgi:hypothetical protein
MDSAIRSVGRWIRNPLPIALTRWRGLGETFSLTWRLRLSTSSHRCLPSFIVVGAMKSGTTSLFSYLRQHPQLVPSCIKEVHYFDGGINPKIDNYERGLGWYRSHFPLRSRLDLRSKVFEATPLYLFNPWAPERIFSVLPDVKIIVILRNPTERAISHYFHERRAGRESLPILDALIAEEKRLESIIEAEDYKNEGYIHYSYKRRGEYKRQLVRYFEHFPREQILVLSFDDLVRTPTDALKSVFEFLQVESPFLPRSPRPRRTRFRRHRVASEVYLYLDQHFLPHNRDLYQLLGTRLGW